MRLATCLTLATGVGTAVLWLFSAWPSALYVQAVERPQQTPKEEVAKERQMTGEDKAAETAKKPEKVIKSEAEWRRLLTREQYRVLRMKGTERPFTNRYDKHFAPGTYSCAACGQELFSSKTKFNSGCGWPAFYAAKAGDRVKLTPDYSHGMIRTEVTCARCDSHLGHIFNDAPQTPTGQRYCINSVSLKFTPAKDAETSDESASEKPTAARGGKPPRTP